MSIAPSLTLLSTTSSGQRSIGQRDCNPAASRLSARCPTPFTGQAVDRRMIDARISIGLPQHPKTKKLIKRLGDGAAWRLICLFLWAASNKPDGNLDGMTAEDIELAVDWPGEDGAFVAAMIEVGFIDGVEGRYTIHDWREHNPWAAGADARSEKARWLATCKHHGKEKAAELMPDYAARLLRSATSMPEADRRQDASMHEEENSGAPSPSPSPSPLPKPLSEQPASIASEDVARETANARAVSIPAMLAKAMRQAGVNAQPADPRLIAIASQGVTAETVVSACEEAKLAKPGERIPVGYVVGIIERWAKDAGQIAASGAVTPLPRGSPRKSLSETRAETIAGLTGANRMKEPRHERDITAESSRLTA